MSKKAGWTIVGGKGKYHYFGEGHSISICGTCAFISISGHKTPGKDVPNEKKCQRCLDELARTRGRKA